jgi:hypothetical protein
MIDLAQIKSQIIQLLEAREKPLSFQEIFDFVLPLLKIDLPNAEHYYSSGNTYEVGQRVFHPAEQVQAWFTVEKIESAEIILVRFDDNQLKRFAQGSTNPKIYRPEPSAFLNNILEDSHEIKQLGSYYSLAKQIEHFPMDRVSNMPALENYLGLMRQNEHINKERLSGFQKICQELALSSMYYVIRLENLISILKHGILARNLAPVDRASFANEEIQSHRHTIVPNADLPFTLHDYVPLFFTSQPPLLYRFLDERARVVKLLVKPSVLVRPGSLFFNMNAVSTRKNQCFHDFQQLRQLNWEMIRGDKWKEGTEEQKNLNSLYRQAEAAIPLRVHPRYFQGLEVANQHALSDVSKLISSAGIDIPVTDQPNFF